MEETIELREIVHIIIKRKWILFFCVLLSVAIAGGYIFWGATPLYKAQTTLIVNSSKGFNTGDIVASFDLGSLNLSQKLVVTYGEITKSRIVLEEVIERLELPMDYEDLLGRTTSQPVGSTEILKISVEHENPEQAAHIANTIADVFIKEVMRILKVNNVEIIDEAIPIFRVINVKTVFILGVGFIGGLLVGATIIIAIEYLNYTLKTEEEIERYLELAVIGEIPVFENLEKKKRRKKG